MPAQLECRASKRDRAQTGGVSSGIEASFGSIGCLCLCLPRAGAVWQRALARAEEPEAVGGQQRWPRDPLQRPGAVRRTRSQLPRHKNTRR